MRRLATLALLVTIVSAAPVGAASPSSAPSSDAPMFPAGTERVLDAVRAFDPRFAELPTLEDAQRRMAAMFDYAPVMAGSWIGALDTFGKLAAVFSGPATGDPWYGLGGSVVEVMLVADCTTEEITPYLIDPSRGDPCGWRHTWLYRVAASGEVTLLFDAGSTDTP